MSEASVSSRSANVRPASLWPYTPFVVLLLAAGLYAIFISGPAARALANEQLQRTIAEENQAVCGKLGMKAGTGAFNDCADALASVRQKQSDRDRAAEQGL